MSSKSGGSSRKHGTTKSKPSQKRYTAEERWKKNKARKQAKAEAFKAACADVRKNAGGRVKDTGRRIRKMRRGEE